MNAKISVDAYEAAERDLFVAQARRIWRRHATVFTVALVALVVTEVRSGSVSWFGYLVVSLWAVALAVHYRGWVRDGESRIREQQSRIEWRAGRSNEYVIPRG